MFYKNLRYKSHFTPLNKQANTAPKSLTYALVGRTSNSIFRLNKVWNELSGFTNQRGAQTAGFVC